jgi:7-cyano-7-deazaguanine synthase
MSDFANGDDVAVLISGGIDSAVLCVDLVARGRRVFPVYVRFGLRWEQVELASVRRFLRAVERPGLMPLHVLDEPVADIYGPHWSTNGSRVPDAQSDDEAVYLPGRNVLLIAKAAVWCMLRDVDELALGCLQSNPFPDSTPEFYRDYQAVLNLAMNGRIRLVRPLEARRKEDVIRMGAKLPLRHTFSCLSPVGDRHCGDCNKCAERRRGFLRAGVTDETPYAASFASTP